MKGKLALLTCLFASVATALLLKDAFTLQSVTVAIQGGGSITVGDLPSINPFGIALLTFNAFLAGANLIRFAWIQVQAEETGTSPN